MARNKPKGAAAWAALEYERAKRRTIGGLCQVAAGGDTDEARHLLEVAAGHLGRQAAGLGASLPPELAGYLARALGRIARGEDPAGALHLKRPPYVDRPDYWKLERDAELARSVSHWMDEGLTLDDAAARVAEHQGAAGLARIAGAVDFESVRKAYLRFYPKDRGKC